MRGKNLGSPAQQGFRQRSEIPKLEADGYKLKEVCGQTRFPVFSMEGRPTGKIVSHYVNSTGDVITVTVGELTADQMASFPIYGDDGTVQQKGRE